MIELWDDVEETTIYGLTTGVQLKAIKGQPLGTWTYYKNETVTDENSPYYGKTIVNSTTGFPVVSSTEEEIIGYADPKFTMGFNTTLRWKDLSLSASLDWRNITFKETTAETAIRHNPAYLRSVAAHPKREVFFNRLAEADSVNSLIVDCLRPTLKQRLRMTLSLCKQLIKKMLKFVIGGGNTKSVKQSNLISIPLISENASVASITFRNKQQGWKSYRMEIKIK